MAFATERWSDQALNYDTKNWKAVRAFDVIATSESDALNASPQIGDSHPENPLMTVEKTAATRPGFNLYLVKCDYSFGDNQKKDAPRPKIKWDIGSTNVPIDLDVDGNPILNSAGDAFDKDPSREITTIHLTYTRNEPYFDVQKSIQYSNTVNSDTINIRGAGTVGPKLMRCLSIQPTKEYSFGEPFLPICYKFEIRGDGWKCRLLDHGNRAWYAPSFGGGNNQFLKGEVFDGNGNRVSSAVPLDGTGQPLDTKLHVGAPAGTSNAANPNPLPTGGQNPPEIQKTQFAVFLKYTVYKALAFGGLNL